MEHPVPSMLQNSKRTDKRGFSLPKYKQKLLESISSEFDFFKTLDCNLRQQGRLIHYDETLRVSAKY